MSVSVGGGLVRLTSSLSSFAFITLKKRKVIAFGCPATLYCPVAVSNFVFCVSSSCELVCSVCGTVFPCTHFVQSFRFMVGPGHCPMVSKYGPSISKAVGPVDPSFLVVK